jgi:hypothetical protein
MKAEKITKERGERRYFTAMIIRTEEMTELKCTAFVFPAPFVKSPFAVRLLQMKKGGES